MRTLVAFLALAAPVAAQPWFLNQPPDATPAGLMAAACEGKANGATCDSCGEGTTGGSWTLRSVRLGHFRSPQSEDAIVTASGCQLRAANSSFTMLLSRTDNGWERLSDMLGAEVDHCRKWKRRDGRSLLVCESETGSTDFLEHAVFALWADGEDIAYGNILTTGDTTRACTAAEIQRAAITRLEVRDLNGDGQPDLAITAVYGKMPMTEALAARCSAAWDAYVQKLKAPASPQPAARAYRLDFIFDGKTFQPTPGSRAALKLFAWER
jgi:hypothetical protein